MKISILNDVLGPILHGPSSSHTAALVVLILLPPIVLVG